MAYPSNFHRLVVIGSLYTDVFNFSLSIVPRAGTGFLGLPAVSPTLLTAVAGAVSTWFPKALGSGGVSPITSAKLTSVKLNRIGTDGKYLDAVTRENIYGAPIAGPSNAHPPAQLTLVATLQSAVPRGAASKGRFFLPPTAPIQEVGTDGRLTIAQATDHANGVKGLIDSLNAVYASAHTGDDALGRVGIASNSGGGQFREVVSVRIGRTVDTMRSRRNKIPEDYQSATITP